MTVFAVLARPIASSAQCPVNAGWWTYEAPNGKAWVYFHVKPSGTAVDSLEFALHGICEASYIKKFVSSGVTITCDPWGFTWSSECIPGMFIDGFDLTVIFVDSQWAQATLDIKIAYYTGCSVCRALEISGVVGANESTWSRIKASSDTR
jgi:hypothetical protein